MKTTMEKHVSVIQKGEKLTECSEVECKRITRNEKNLASDIREYREELTRNLNFSHVKNKRNQMGQQQMMMTN